MVLCLCKGRRHTSLATLRTQGLPDTPQQPLVSDPHVNEPEHTPRPWQDLFVGRRAELEHLRGAWRRAHDGDPQLVVLLAETGMGKTRLVQAFYSWLSQTQDAPDPDGYWPDWLERDRSSLSVNPPLRGTENPPSVPWLWWGLRFSNPALRNRAESPPCGLVHSLPLLTPHFAPLQRAKEAKAESVELGVGTMTALVGLLGMATLGPVAGGVVAGLSALSSLKEKVDLLRGAKKVLELKRKDDPSLAERAMAEREDAVARIGAYFTALLTKGADGKGAIPIVLVLDDAQWIDPDTLAFVDRLMRDAKEKGLPLMVVSTHWEREWYEHADAGDGSTSLAAWARENPDLVGETWQPVAIGKVVSEDLEPVLSSALPGLTEPQRERIMQRVDGNPGFLFDLVTLLTTSKRKFFEGRDPTRPLKASAEKQLDALTALDHYQLNLQRFGDLDEEIKALLAWSSYQGTRFVDALTLEVARRLEGDGSYDVDDLREAETPYALIDAVTRMSHEFRQRTIHEIAAQELREIEEDFHEFRDALRETLSEWFESGRLDEFEAGEREQLLRLLIEAVSALEVSPDVRRTLGRALGALFEHYQDNGQQRLAVHSASRLVEAMPDSGWPGETVAVQTQWSAAGILDEHLRFAEAQRLWDQLIPRLEAVYQAKPDLKNRTWLAGAYLSRGLGQSRASGSHLAMAPGSGVTQGGEEEREVAKEVLGRAIDGFSIDGRPPWVSRMLARSFAALGALLRDPLQPEAGIAEYERAIAELEAIPLESDDRERATTLLGLAKAYTNLAGTLERVEGGLATAQAHLDTALALLQRVQLESDGSQQESVTNALADLHFKRCTNAARRGDAEQSLHEVEQGLALAGWSFTESERWSPDDYLGFAAAHFNRSKALTELDRPLDAIACLGTAITSFEALHERAGSEWPLTWDSMLSLLLDKRQVLLDKVERRTEARADRVRIFGMKEAQEELGPAWTPKRRDLVMRASAAGFASQWGEAVEALEALRDDCGEDWPFACRVRLVTAYVFRGFDMLGDGGPEEIAAAEAAIHKAVALGEMLASEEGFLDSKAPQALMRAYDLSAMSLPDDAPEDAQLETLDRAVEIARRVMGAGDLEASPYLNDLARAHERRGKVHRKAEEWSDTSRFFREAIHLRELAARQSSSDREGPAPLGRWSNFLLLDYFELGRAEAAEGRHQAADESFTAAIELGARLREPGRFRIADYGSFAMANAYQGRARVRAHLHDIEGARGDCDAAIEILTHIDVDDDAEDMLAEIAVELTKTRTLLKSLTDSGSPPDE